ncbi:MAG: adenylate kinase [Candidatus Glassbacteria bacterium]
MMRLIILGAPGAGKGTQASMIEEKLGLVKISTGDILRDAVRNRTRLGTVAKEYVDKGLLVPDNVILDLMKERIGQDDCKKGFILDGFPRTEVQAVALDELMRDLGLVIDAVIYINVSDEEILRRITGRRYCPECNALYNIYSNPPKRDMICDRCGKGLAVRGDDTEETVRQRLELYREMTMPLLDRYRKNGNLLEVDGEKKPQEIFERIDSMISNEVVKKSDSA